MKHFSYMKEFFHELDEGYNSPLEINWEKTTNEWKGNKEKHKRVYSLMLILLVNILNDLQ